MKRIVLLDLDNTIIDFNECARRSIMGIFEDLGFRYDDSVFETFITENVKIWKRLELGEIDKAYLRANRWNIILQKLGIDYDGTIIEERFENGVALGAYPVDGAYELLDYLYDKYDLYVVYNGNYDSTMHKFGPESIEALGELRHNSRIFASFNHLIKTHWSKHNTLVGFAMDHGCHEIDGGCGSHGLDMDEDLNIVHLYKAYKAE